MDALCDDCKATARPGQPPTGNRRLITAHTLNGHWDMRVHYGMMGKIEHGSPTDREVSPHDSLPRDLWRGVIV